MAIDTNELKELAEDLHVNGYNRYASAMSQAADELAKWEAVFGHLGNTPDECGNAIVAARDELEECCDELSADKDTWYRMSEVFSKRITEMEQDIRHKQKRIQTLESALIRIKSWDEHTLEFAVDYGSNGVRDHYRNIARGALEETK